MHYKHYNADFQKMYCKLNKRNIWMLGYFGGGSINISDAMKVAKDFAETTGCKVEDVQIDEVFKSQRHKGFKYVFTVKKQEPCDGAHVYDDAYKWLFD